MSGDRKARSAKRLIRNGSVRFFGRTYHVVTRDKPDINGHQEPKYEGQLDGMKAWFYDYGALAERGSPSVRDACFLHSFNDDTSEGLDEPNVVGGFYCWTRWEAPALEAAVLWDRMKGVAR